MLGAALKSIVQSVIIPTVVDCSIKNVTLSITTHDVECHTQAHCAFKPIVLSVAIQSVIMPSVMAYPINSVTLSITTHNVECHTQAHCA